MSKEIKELDEMLEFHLNANKAFNDCSLTLSLCEKMIDQVEKDKIMLTVMLKYAERFPDYAIKEIADLMKAELKKNDLLDEA